MDAERETEKGKNTERRENCIWFKIEVTLKKFNQEMCIQHPVQLCQEIQRCLLSIDYEVMNYKSHLKEKKGTY